MTFRRRLLLASLATLIVGLGALLLAGNVLLDRRVSSETSSLLRARAEATLATVSVGRHGIVVREAANDDTLDRQAWVIGAGRVIERPAGADPALDGAAVALGRSGGTAERAAPGDLRLRAQPIPGRDGEPPAGAVVVGLSTRSLEQLEQQVLIGSLVIALLILVAGGIAIRSALDGALRPVADMTRAARDWGAHDLERRFGLGPPRDELTALAATLDGLLARIAASRRHEQRFASEMAHELRTPLAALRGRAELALAAAGPTAGERERALQAIVAQAKRLQHRSTRCSRSPARSSTRPPARSTSPRSRASSTTSSSPRRPGRCRRARASPTSSGAHWRRSSTTRAATHTGACGSSSGRAARAPDSRCATTARASTPPSATASSSRRPRPRRRRRSRSPARAPAGTLLRRGRPRGRRSRWLLRARAGQPGCRRDRTRLIVPLTVISRDHSQASAPVRLAAQDEVRRHPVQIEYLPAAVRGAHLDARAVDGGDDRRFTRTEVDDFGPVADPGYMPRRSVHRLPGLAGRDFERLKHDAGSEHLVRDDRTRDQVRSCRRAKPAGHQRRGWPRRSSEPEASGFAVWNAFLIAAGRQLGANWERIGAIIGPISAVVVGCGAVPALASRLVWRRGRAKRASVSA